MIPRYFSLLLVILTTSITFGSTTNNLKNTTNGFAKIRFVDKNEVYSKTYIGKLTKGDLQSLKYELQNNLTSSQSGENDVKKSESAIYVDRVTSQNLKKEWKKSGKRAKNDLLGNYVVEDEESLVEIKEKKLKEQEERASKTKISDTQKLNENTSPSRPNAYLSKHYRITSKRIHNVRTIKKRAGYVGLIVKYKIREGNYINTYINVVEDYLKEGSNYYLKYHGNGSNRKYYLEYYPKK